MEVENDKKLPWDWQLIVIAIIIKLFISGDLIGSLASAILLGGSYRLLKNRWIESTFVSVILTIPLAMLFMTPVVLLKMVSPELGNQTTPSVVEVSSPQTDLIAIKAEEINNRLNDLMMEANNIEYNRKAKELYNDALGYRAELLPFREFEENREYFIYIENLLEFLSFSSEMSFASPHDLEQGELILNKLNNSIQKLEQQSL